MWIIREIGKQNGYIVRSEKMIPIVLEIVKKDGIQLEVLETCVIPLNDTMEQ